MIKKILNLLIYLAFILNPLILNAFEREMDHVKYSPYNQLYLNSLQLTLLSPLAEVVMAPTKVVEKPLPYSSDRQTIQRICEGRFLSKKELRKKEYNIFWDSSVVPPSARILKLSAVIQLYMDQFFDKNDQLMITPDILRQKAKEEFSDMKEFSIAYLSACRYGSEHELKRYRQCQVIKRYRKYKLL